MSEHYDSLETRDPQEREEALMAALPGQVRHAQEHTGAFARILAGVDAASVDARAALAALPVTRKSDVMAMQREEPPFGGLVAGDFAAFGRVFASPGPVFEPEALRADYWRMARALFAAGLRRGDLVHNTFSYHFTPAGSMMESGAHAIGCTVFPAGIGQTEMQLQAIAALRPVAYAGTPSFLNILLDKAAEVGADVTSVCKGLVGGEALPPSLRTQLADKGVSVLQCYATADVGLIAYESPQPEGMIIDEGVIVEIVRPGTGDPVAEGEVGEVVVTTLNPDYPLIRFGTGDLSAALPGQSACGRSGARLEGWMGRADQTAKVRGMFVHPSQVAAVIKRHPEIAKARLVVDSIENKDQMLLRCELGAPAGDGLAEAVATSIREVCKLRGDVEFVAAGALPDDGKVIDDVRTYE